MVKQQAKAQPLDMGNKNKSTNIKASTRVIKKDNLEIKRNRKELREKLSTGEMFMKACERGNMILLENIDIEKIDEMGDILEKGFLGAIEKGQIEVVKYLMRVGEDECLILPLDEGFLMACEGDKRKIMEILFEVAEDVTDQGRNRTLRYCIENRNFEMASRLLEKIHLENEVEILRENYRLALEIGDMETIEWVMESKVLNRFGEDFHGISRSHKYGHIDISYYVLEKGMLDLDFFVDLYKEIEKTTEKVVLQNYIEIVKNNAIQSGELDDFNLIQIWK